MEVDKFLSKKFSCEICHKTFTLKKRRNLHMKGHQGRIKCSLCDKSFIYKAHLNDHMNEKHDKKLFQCHICSKIFNGRTVLTKHIRIKHANVNQELKCEVCDKSFKYKHSLDEHIVSRHKHKTFDEKSQNGRIVFQCKYCDKHFCSKKWCLNHINTIHVDNDAQRQFKCQECFKQFTYQWAFQKHMATAHDDDRFQDKVVIYRQIEKAPQKLSPRRSTRKKRPQLPIDEDVETQDVEEIMIEIELNKVHKLAPKKVTKKSLKQPQLPVQDDQDIIAPKKAIIKPLGKSSSDLASLELRRSTRKRRPQLTIDEDDETQDVEGSYRCEQCNATFEIEDDFLEHIFSPHESEL